MEKNSMALMDEALNIIKEKYADQPHLAYAAFAGYVIAAVDLKTANFVLECVKENNK
jgi:hypothetical protein